MSQNPGMQPGPEPDPTVTTCSNCHSPMPAGLRFCRNCGFRLGEGLAEYTETIRFQNGHPGVGFGAVPTSPQQAAVTSYGLGGAGVTGQSCALKRRRKVSGMTWMFLGLLIFFLTAGVFTAVVTPRRTVFIGGPPSAPAPPPRSYFGINGFEQTDGGLTFGNVEPPGSPADKAGLVGGDIITSFDGQPVEETDQMIELLQNTPIGKTVEVKFIRDGETKTTKLTTMSKEDSDRLANAFRTRPEGRGLFGYEDDEVERVAIPNTKIFGIKLGTVDQSRPADLAGIKKGDIIIAFDKVPTRTREELLSRVRRALPYSTVTVTLIRDGEEMNIPVKMGKQ